MKFDYFELKCTNISTKTASDDRAHLKNGIWPRSISLWMTTFYLSLFIIRPWEQLLPWLGEIHFERIYAICMIIAVILGYNKRFRMTFQSAAVILFLLAVGLSGLFAWNPSLSWENFYAYLCIVIFYFILILVIRTPYEMVFVAAGYIMIMAIYLAKAQWEFFVNGQHRYDMGVVRLVGIEDTFGGPNNLAMSIVASLPILLFLWSVRNWFNIGWPTIWYKWFSRSLIGYFFLAVTSVVLTNSRSGMAGFVLFIILTTFQGRGVLRKLSYIIVGATLLFMFWLVIPAENQGRFRTIWDPKAGPENAQTSAEGRIEGYKAGIEMFKRFPLTGVGVGNFNVYREKYVDGVRLNAHNLVGQVLGETGLIGGMTFLLLVIAILVNCHKSRVLARNSFDSNSKVISDFALACRNAIILLSFEGLFGHNLLRFNWLWLGAFSVLAMEYAYLQRIQKSN